jgi:AAA domain-containing protein
MNAVLTEELTDEGLEIDLDAELAKILTYASIPKLPRIALWPKHLYRGTVTMLAGPGGCGKGLTGVHAAAVVTQGALFPGESALGCTRDRTPGSVIGIWPEDDPNEDMAWRLEAALAGQGAVLDRVYDMTETAEGEPFDLNNGGEESLARIAAQIESLAACDGELPCGCGKPHENRRFPVRLLIIDPLLAVADTLSTNKQARKTMRPLMALVKRYGIACLVIHHTVKDGKVASSKGLTDVLRLVFTVSHDPRIEGVVLLRKEKANNLGPIPDLRYKLAGTEDSPYLEWVEGLSAATAPTWRQDGRKPPARPAAKPAARPARGSQPAWRAPAGRPAPRQGADLLATPGGTEHRPLIDWSTT